MIDLDIFWEKTYEYMNINEILVMEGVIIHNYSIYWVVFNILRTNSVVWGTFSA